MYDIENPCENCSQADWCDYWDAYFCPNLNEYLGIDDYDPWDI